jgi:hypothetical protein
LTDPASVASIKFRNSFYYRFSVVFNSGLCHVSTSLLKLHPGLRGLD